MTSRVGVVGYGRWGENIVRDLIDLGVDVSVAEQDVARRDRARAAGAKHQVSSADQLPECDGYVVVTPARTHRAACELLLERGSPVFVEKPPCTTVDDVHALALKAPDRLFVMYKWRYHPGVRALAAIARSGRLGLLQRLETVRTGPELLPSDVDVLWHLATHDLSIAVEILGAAAPVRVVHASRAPGGRITRCVATMANDDGPEHLMSVAAGVPDRVRRVVVTGTEGSASLEHPGARTISVRDRGGVREVEIPSTMPLADELRAFVAHLGGGPPPLSDALTALTIVRRLADLQHHADSETL